MNRWWIEINGQAGFDLEILYHIPGLEHGALINALRLYELGTRATLAQISENAGEVHYPPRHPRPDQGNHRSGSRVSYYIGGAGFPTSSEKRPGDVPMQIGREWCKGRVWINEKVHRMAVEEYNRQGNPQTHERLVERGGLGAGEIIALLADALERTAREAPLG